MKEKIKNAFDKIEADEELKTRTRLFLSEKTKSKSEHKFFRVPRYVPAAICFLFVLFAGGHVILTPAATISIDVNPSIELDINRFDQVIKATPYNDDGELLTDSLHLTFKNYNEAVEAIMECSEIESLLSEDELLSITVVGNAGKQCGKILSDMEQYTSGQTNVSCSFTESSEVADAHDCGLSYGKYNAFLELHALDPEITEDTVQDMTMREIRDMIDSLSGIGSDSSNSSENGGNSASSHKNQNEHDHTAGQGMGRQNGKQNSH